MIDICIKSLFRTKETKKFKKNNKRLQRLPLSANIMIRFIHKLTYAYNLENMAQESLPGYRKLPDYVGKCT